MLEPHSWPDSFCDFGPTGVNFRNQFLRYQHYHSFRGASIISSTFLYECLSITFLFCPYILTIFYSLLKFWWIVVLWPVLGDAGVRFNFFIVTKKKGNQWATVRWSTCKRILGIGFSHINILILILIHMIQSEDFSFSYEWSILNAILSCMPAFSPQFLLSFMLSYSLLLYFWMIIAVRICLCAFRVIMWVLKV